MAHYTINLPGNINGDVRQGKVSKKHIGFLTRWPFINLHKEQRIGYVVTVNDTAGKQYHLLKTSENKWPSQQEHLSLAIKTQGKWQPIEEDQITTAIKKAIDDYENKQ